MKRNNYEQMSEAILELAGGPENLRKVSHCFTRLRLDVEALDKCDVEGLKKVEGAKGCVVNSGQVQVIIGKEVEDLYPVFLKKAGISEDVRSVETAEDKGEENC